MTMVKDFVRDISNDTKYENFILVLDAIIQYHNSYGQNVKGNNYWDWLMILPINISVMTNGFLAGIETKRNKKAVRSYRLLVTELVQDVVDKIEKLEPIDD